MSFSGALANRHINQAHAGEPTAIPDASIDSYCALTDMTVVVNMLNNGLAVTQFYSGAGRTAAGGRILGGAQDNYSLVLQAGFWRRFASGSG